MEGGAKDEVGRVKGFLAAKTWGKGKSGHGCRAGEGWRAEKQICVEKLAWMKSFGFLCQGVKAGPNRRYGGGWACFLSNNRVVDRGRGEGTVMDDGRGFWANEKRRKFELQKWSSCCKRCLILENWLGMWGNNLHRCKVSDVFSSVRLN